MITKQDYAIAALVGFLVGVFAIPTVVNLGIKSRAVLLLLPLVVPPLWVFGVWLGGFLGRFFPFMAQLGKFAAVGFLNAAIDFGILNLLSMASGITKGFVLGGVNVPGFAVAVINSYLWNKFWVFHPVRGKTPAPLENAFLTGPEASAVPQEAGRTSNGVQDRGGKSIFSDFPTFLVVTVVGLLINSGAVVVITTYIPPLFGVNESAWLNLAKAAAAVVSLGWNFVGYKFIVFRPSAVPSTQ